MEWLERLEASLALAVLCILLTFLFFLWMFYTYILVLDSRGIGDYLIAAAVGAALLGIVIFEYLTLQVFHHHYTKCWRPTSLSIAFSQFEEPRLIREAKGIWWLLHVAAVIAAIGFWLSHLYLTPSDLDGPDMEVLRAIGTLFKISVAVGAVYASNAFLLCAVAAWTRSQRAVLFVWRARFLIDAVLLMGLGLVQTMTR